MFSPWPCGFPLLEKPARFYAGFAGAHAGFAGGHAGLLVDMLVLLVDMLALLVVKLVDQLDQHGQAGRPA